MEQKKRKAYKIIAKLKELYPTAEIALHYSNPWELLVAVILSAQCTDKKVNEVTEKLFKKYPTLDDYVNAKQEEFEQDIRSTGFYKNKAKNVLTSAKIINEKYGGKIPDTMDNLIALPGVARKTANIVLDRVHHKIEGIAVDTHVRRLSNLLGLTESEDPIKIEQDLMQIIPRKEWMNFSYRLIYYGREYCVAKKHDHENCPLNNIN